MAELARYGVDTLEGMRYGRGDLLLEGRKKGGSAAAGQDAERLACQLAGWLGAMSPVPWGALGPLSGVTGLVLLHFQLRYPT